MRSGGRYFTVVNENSAHLFINGIIVNGLTRNDNPAGDNTTLLNGLDAAHYINGSNTEIMSYTAQTKERLDFTVTSVDAGELTAQIVLGDSVLAKSQTPSVSNSFSVVAPHGGQIDIKVTAQNAQDLSIFTVGVTSNLPAENCTVGVGPRPTGPNAIVAKTAGPIVSIVGFLVLLYPAWKYFMKKPSHGPVTSGDPASGSHGVDKLPVSHITEVQPSQSQSSWSWFKFPQHLPHQPPSQPRVPDDKHPRDNNNNDSDHHSDASDSGSDDDPESDTEPDQNNNSNSKPKHKLHKQRKPKSYSNAHHHHIPSQHPCSTLKCSIVAEEHDCSKYSPQACTCIDPKCALNLKKHKCKDDHALHTCEGPEKHSHCPLNNEEFAKLKKMERDALVAKYRAQDMAKRASKMAVKHVVHGAVAGF
jgi:hypothetical protein